MHRPLKEQVQEAHEVNEQYHGWMDRFSSYIIQLDMYFSKCGNNTSWTIHKTDRYIDNKNPSKSRSVHD
jgi:hypothetical protein